MSCTVIRRIVAVGIAVLANSCCPTAQAQSDPSSSAAKTAIVQANLTAPGSPSFHLQAEITDKDDPENQTKVEIYWVNPTKWRRDIKSSDFSQTLIVSGSDVLDEHTDDYMPLVVETLVNAMTNPALCSPLWVLRKRLTQRRMAPRTSRAFCVSGRFNRAAKGHCVVRHPQVYAKC